MHRLFLTLAAVIVLLLVGCASTKRPVLYPNQHFNAVGQHQANADIDACMRAAQASGANDNRNQDLAKDTAKAGAVGRPPERSSAPYRQAQPAPARALRSAAPARPRPPWSAAPSTPRNRPMST